MKKRIIILGSTGSIGKSTLDVLSGLEDQWQVVGLGAGSRADQLAAQANRWRPEAVALADPEGNAGLSQTLEYKPELCVGPDAHVELLSRVACDCVVCAVVGSEGLPATVKAVELGVRVALANKEAMVVAGSLLMHLARGSGATIIPIDSEHSAIFQALQAGRTEEVRNVYLTASGGPFWSWPVEDMQEITLEKALQHPTWNMGPKITIDSATMMNKALEIVEARWLFDLDSDRIKVVVHPESIIHSLVEFCDGSMIAQLGTPDMRTPIQYALTYPKRLPCPSEPLDLFGVGRLNLHRPDEKRFPAIRLGHEVARRGGTCGAVLNGANEAAVDLFRKECIPFLDIARLTERVLAEHEFEPSPSLEELLSSDRWAREEVARCTTC